MLDKPFMTDEDFMKEYFPFIDPRVRPFGERVLVQYKLVRKISHGGIVLVEDTKDINRENTVLAKVVNFGELAYRNRDTGQRWPEGTWCKPGDVVLVPKWGGFRFPRFVGEDTVIFAMFKDHEIIAGPTGGFDELDQIL